MLFLFDIDGTLLRGMPPLHRMALCDAADRIYAVSLSPDDLGQTAGMTDSFIIQRALTQYGLPPNRIEAGLPAFFGEAAIAYRERLELSDLTPYHTPHARSALGWLRDKGVVLGLVTGNIQAIAWAKLSAADLSQFFTTGGFGDEAAEREHLPPLALARLERSYGREFRFEPVFVVGDTPDDVHCGAACGLSTIAVATGPLHSRAELKKTGADYVIDDLGELAALSYLWE